MRRIVFYAVLTILFCPFFCYAAKYTTNSFIIKFPDNWSPAYTAPRLTLIPEDKVIITVDSYAVNDISKEIDPIKKEKGINQPTNILDVLSYKYVRNEINKGWQITYSPKITNTGGYKTIYIELSKDKSFKSFQIFEKENVYIFSLTTNSLNKFNQYKPILQNIIAKDFYIKAGNPIYMVIGMTIAYIASFIGLIAAYIYYKRRERMS